MAEGIVRGNVRLVVCFGLYLAWWVAAFNPVRPVRGLRSAWLLLFALAFGVLATLDICSSLRLTGGLLDGRVVITAGVVGYVVAAAVTSRTGRPVTTELIIIVLWAIVSVMEVSTLVGLGCVGVGVGWALMALCLVSTAACLVCYQLFYGLDARAAFVDGTIPLLLAPAVAALIAWLAR